MNVQSVLAMFRGLVGIAHPHYGLLAGLVGTVVVAGLVWLVIWQRRLVRSYEHDLLAIQELIRTVRHTDSLEQNLSRILKTVGHFVPAPYIACYVLDESTNRFTLRAVSHPYDEFSAVAPSYSGLALPSQEAYVPPVSVNPPESEGYLEIGAEETYYTFTYMTHQQLAVIRLVTPEKVAPGTQKQLSGVLSEMEVMLDDLVVSERIAAHREVEQIADHAVKQIAAVSTDANAAVELLMQALHAADGVYGALYMEDLPMSGAGVHGVGETETIARELGGDAESVQRIRKLAAQKPYLLVSRQNSEFYKLPSAISALEISAIALVRTPARGVLVLLLSKDLEASKFEEQGLVQVRTLATVLGKISSNYEEQSLLAQGNARLLQDMVDLLDNLNPYTVGYSESMMRYAVSIGKQMGMVGQELLDLGLAARLSNIGVIGLDRDLLFKEGRFTEFEYESMKLHSEIGASMIQIATGNRRAASFVLYHHERMDGNGYPRGIKGDAIPLGARILHVVQFFLAKVNGRPWRPAVRFEDALTVLEEVAGAQLDEAVVRAFRNWLVRVEREAQAAGTTLAPCMEMLNVPASICQSCPVVTQRSSVKCWEVGGEHCTMHGRACDTCIVKSEYEYRQKFLRQEVQG